MKSSCKADVIPGIKQNAMVLYYNVALSEFQILDYVTSVINDPISSCWTNPNQRQVSKTQLELNIVCGFQTLSIFKCLRDGWDHTGKPPKLNNFDNNTSICNRDSKTVCSFETSLFVTKVNFAKNSQSNWTSLRAMPK